MPWVIMEERYNGTSPCPAGNSAARARSTTGDDYDARIARLSAQVEQLKNRKVIRAAYLLGRGARRARGWLCH
jgi:hypothetical protein